MGVNCNSVIHAKAGTPKGSPLGNPGVEGAIWLFLFALVTEGVTWNMVMALGKTCIMRDDGFCDWCR